MMPTNRQHVATELQEKYEKEREKERRWLERRQGIKCSFKSRWNLFLSKKNLLFKFFFSKQCLRRRGIESMTWLLNLAQAPRSRARWSSLHTRRKRKSSVLTLTRTLTRARRKRRSSALTLIKHHLSLWLNVLSQSNDNCITIDGFKKKSFFYFNSALTHCSLVMTCLLVPPYFRCSL